MEQHTLRGAVSNVQTLPTKKYQQATSIINGYVSDNPWRAIGIATAIGALTGFLTTRIGVLATRR